MTECMMGHNQIIDREELFKNEKIKFKKNSCSPVLLDLNFLELDNIAKQQYSRQLVNIPIDLLSDINKTLEKDAKFLARCGLLDYSLLLVVEEIGPK